jgi:crotonobetainyl-CoA:carnitine CoA-transferase CaiB-like acyl-CoA transferase
MYDVLAGVHVLEVASWTFVPSCGAILADWGADVVKVELPDVGDPQRRMFTEQIANQPGIVLVDLPNRGKRSLGLDLGTKEGQGIFHRLVESADVVITSFLPAARRRLRIDVDDLRAINPKIIVAIGSGQGTRGPEANAGGYDYSSAYARSGMAFQMTGSGPEVPQLPPALGDLYAGFALASGVAAALFRRERTGTPSVVDVSLLSAAMWGSATNIMAAAYDSEILKSTGRLDPPIHPVVNSYRTRDGRWLYLVLLQSDRYWEEFVERIGRPEFVTDPRFNTEEARVKNKVECVRALDAVFAERTLEEWKVALDGIQGPWAVVQSFSEVLRDPQVIANDYVVPIDGTDCQRVVVPSPVQFDGPIGAIGRTPQPGEQTEAILNDLGLKTATIQDLRSRGIVG